VKDTFEVTMTDNKGNKWTESAYDGYGEFDGKDFYQLVAEMSRPDKCNGDVEHDRLIGIGLFFGTGGIRSVKDGTQYLASNVDFWNWGEPLVNGKSPNDLLDNEEWEHITVFEDNVLFPNLTENPDHKWVNEKPDDCENQGFFYDYEEEDECECW
tara:strand:- start:47 stop:511 length:465 start_codon:yes stop_codon:yes gene_type:complete